MTVKPCQKGHESVSKKSKIFGFHRFFDLEKGRKVTLKSAEKWVKETVFRNSEKICKNQEKKKNPVDTGSMSCASDDGVLQNRGRIGWPTE